LLFEQGCGVPLIILRVKIQDQAQTGVYSSVLSISDKEKERVLARLQARKDRRPCAASAEMNLPGVILIRGEGSPHNHCSRMPFFRSAQGV
jgi:hypothetical protein